MLPILNIGPLALQVPGLILLVGVWLALVLAERYTKNSGVPTNILYSLIFIGLIAGLIGARLSYIIQYFEIFSQNPGSVISINPGLLDPLGGMLSASLAMGVYGRHKNLKLWETLDALTPFLNVMVISISVSLLASGSAYGAPTDVPWAVELWGELRHPTQIYAIFAGLIILAVLWPGRTYWQSQESGVYFLSFISLTSLSVIIIEAFLADSNLIFGGFRSNQILALIVLALSLWCMIRLKNTTQEVNENI